MDAGPLQHKRFRRGTEQRIAATFLPTNRRQRVRRTLDMGWVPLFRDAEKNALDEALGDCEVLLLPAGTPLLKYGEANHNVYILLSGEVAAYLDGNLTANAAIPISPGECIGEFSAIDGKPVSALVQSVTEARVLKLPRQIFWNRLMALPGVASNLMVTLTERMRKTNVLALKAQREQLELIHLRKELDVARQLQASMLPLQRPMFPERDDIEVCGFMEPASDVGGDLFDAFFVDDKNLFFCIGDVSGHGITAALFMARAIGLLRILAMNTLQPDKLLGILNDRLCIGNETNIFITLFCGILDVDSGRLIYSNGGHCAPILSAKGQTQPLIIPKGALIGALPGMAYSSLELDLKPGELLFCYTDGVTEAQNCSSEEFSEDRCLEIIAKSGSPPLPMLLENLRREVAHFSGTDMLADDCTMLALRRPDDKSENE